MTDESYSFTAAKMRLDEIVTQVRKKDTSLEKSLDLLEEGVRLANVCTELIDHADWASAPDAAVGSPGGAHAASAQQVDVSDTEADDAEGAASDDAPEAPVEETDTEGTADDAVGDVWSEDEAWADEAEDDPSDGDDGHGD